MIQLTYTFLKKYPIYLSIYLSLLCIALPSYALDVAGVDIPQQVTTHHGDPVKLLGASVRSKFIVKVYVGAFYASKKLDNRFEAMSFKGSKRMVMHFMRDVSAEKMQDAWHEGFRSNNEANTINKFEKEIEEFLDYFSNGVKDEDVFVFDFIPKTGVAVIVNGKHKTTIHNPDFYTLLLSTWMGNKPPSKKFQKELLNLE